MIHINRNFETMIVQFVLRGVPDIGYHEFQISMELLSLDTFLHDFYSRFRRFTSSTADCARFGVTRQNTDEFFELKVLASRARVRYASHFESNNLGAQTLSEGSVFA